MCPARSQQMWGEDQMDSQQNRDREVEVFDTALGVSQSDQGAGEESDYGEVDTGSTPEGATPDAPVPPEAADFSLSDYEPTWRKRYDTAGNPLLIVVDRSGIHLLPGIWCRCQQAVPEEYQALDMGLYPASAKTIRTVFTFQCLDDFLTDNQECNTSAYHYVEKLRRLTNSSFPHTAPV